MNGRSSPDKVSTKLHRIAEQSRQMPTAVLTTLAHHIDVELLHEAYRRTRKDGATGIDGQTATEYTANLGENLRSLENRLKSGRYVAPPVRRVHIPKGEGKTRPIGIPTFEDKVLQRAVTMVLEAVYEQEFLDCSHGFRPGRSAHQALQVLWQELTKMKGGWVIEVDIESFFDHLDHAQLRSFLDRRVRDGVLRRAIDKWLKAGVLDGGIVSYPDEGTPQGGVISPLLANIYLHEVFDMWFEREVKRRLKGRAFAIRYADDIVIAFSTEQDARRVFDVLPKRFGRYGLKLHPQKTRVVEFQRPDRSDRPPSNRPGTFDVLGFTHHWGKSWRGSWVLKRKTMRSRFSRAMRAISAWCRIHRHESVADQHRSLARKLTGHYAYYGITGNAHALARFAFEVERVWRKWLGRRSQRAKLSWMKFQALRRRYKLPPPRVVHSIYQRSEPAT